MSDEIRRLCLDTNTLLLAVLRPVSQSRQIIKQCEAGRFRLVLSRPVLAEYRSVLTHPSLTGRGPLIEPERVTALLDRLRYRADVLNLVRAKFSFDRDPTDSIFIELAIAGRATHIISHDKDLLSLPTSRTDAGKRFRQRLRKVQVMDAATFVREHAAMFEATTLE